MSKKHICALGPRKTSLKGEDGEKAATKNFLLRVLQQDEWEGGEIHIQIIIARESDDRRFPSGI